VTWLINGHVIDVRTGTIAKRSIQTQAGHIVTLSAGPPKQIPEAELIDVAGAYLLPGFFDCHVHICLNTQSAYTSQGWGNALPGTIAIYAAQAARRLLMAGVTTVRDVGGWDYHEIAVREAIRKGWIEGPRLHCAGRILTITSSTTAYYPGMYEEADGPDAVRRAARKQLAHGAQFIKVLATGAVASTEYENPMAVQFQAQEIQAAVDVATDNLTYVAAHAHSPDGIRNAVECGCRSVEHSVFGNEAVYRLMAERGTYLVPTLCVTQAMFSDPTLSAQVPKHLQRRFQEIHDTHVANIRLAKRLGVKIAMGSDAGTPGNHCGDNLQELEVMVREAGLSPLEAIQASTLEAATLMRLDQHLGLLEVNKVADIVATVRNPLEDISALRKVVFVMKDGKVVKNSLPS
jgi:imidazolonepropionase-like amidohydrolase